MTFLSRAFLNTQYSSLTMPGDNATTAIVSGSITVLNSAYVAIRRTGQTSAPGSIPSPASPYCYLTLQIVDPTHITVTSNRFTAGDWVDVTGFEVIDLNPYFIKAIYRGTINAFASIVIPAIVIANTQLDHLGQTAGAAFVEQGILSFPDTTHISLNSSDSILVSYQAIEGH